MKRYNKSSLFLMELIIAILFFAIASAVCLQVFVKAHTMNEESQNNSQAALIAGNIAEVYRSDQLQGIYRKDSKDFVYFDESGQIADENQYIYKALLSEKDDILSISILYKEKTIYSLDCMHYHQKTFKGDESL